MDNKLTEDFLAGVNEIVKSEDDKDHLFVSLRDYRNSLDLDALLKSLRSVITTPDRLILYDVIRPLIPVNHQLAYDRRTYWASTQRRLRVVRLPRRDLPPNTKLGFAVRGGLEHGVGFFVSKVTPDSIAARAGLKEGDQIVRLNGFQIERATHNEVMALIRSRSELLLKVRRVGLLPQKEHVDDSVSWVMSSAADEESDRVSNRSEEFSSGEEIRLFLNTRGSQSLGCTIVSGPPSKPGIFIQSVVPDGLSEQAGLREGDQIMEVNGTPFFDISHSSAILTLKSSHHLMITIRRGTGLSLLHQKMDFMAPPKDALELRKVAQLRELTSGRNSEVKMTVKRHNDDDGLASTLTIDSSSDTLTPSIDGRTVDDAPSSNSNVFFRRPDAVPPTASHREHSTPSSPFWGNNHVPERKTTGASTVLTELEFSSRETGGRTVESVRLTLRPPMWGTSGVELEEVPGGRLVMAQVDYGSPAFQADVRKGDYLLAIGRDKVGGKRLDAVNDMLKRAEAQPQYILTLGRAPSGIFDDEVTYF